MAHQAAGRLHTDRGGIFAMTQGFKHSLVYQKCLQLTTSQMEGSAVFVH